MKIIYPFEDTFVIIAPAPFFPYPTEEVARKDVPEGVPYLIVDDSVLPSDTTFRNAWTADFSNPDGYGIGADAWFKEQESKQ